MQRSIESSSAAKNQYLRKYVKDQDERRGDIKFIVLDDEGQPALGVVSVEPISHEVVEKTEAVVQNAELSQDDLAEVANFHSRVKLYLESPVIVLQREAEDRLDRPSRLKMSWHDFKEKYPDLAQQIVKHHSIEFLLNKQIENPRVLLQPASRGRLASYVECGSSKDHPLDVRIHGGKMLVKDKIVPMVTYDHTAAVNKLVVHKNAWKPFQEQLRTALQIDYERNVKKVKVIHELKKLVVLDEKKNRVFQFQQASKGPGDALRFLSLQQFFNQDLVVLNTRLQLINDSEAEGLKKLESEYRAQVNELELACDHIWGGN